MFENDDVKPKIEVLKRSEKSCSSKSCKNYLQNLERNVMLAEEKSLKRNIYNPD